MKKIYNFSSVLLFALLSFNLNAQCGNLYIEGVIDGPLTGGTPKAVQFCANAAIADLSIYGFGSANNGGGTDGEEFTFPTLALNSGDCIWVASENTQFNNWFGFSPCFEDAAANINGDDAIELFCSGSLSDIYGDINVDGTGQPWEYADGWANANDALPNITFNLSDWTFENGAIAGETDNATAITPYPNVMVNCPITLPDLTIGDVAMLETNSGTTVFTFTVSLSAMDAVDVTFDINTMDDSATVGDNDYIAITGGTGTITANTLTTTVDITVNGDINIENDENFEVLISNVSANANLLDGTGIGTISDDDTPIVLISEISVCDQQVELYNAGLGTIDLSTWRLCNFPQYDDIGDVAAVTVISGSITLAPGNFVTLGWTDINISAGELGLYLPTGGFGDPAAIHDYVQYNSINNTRAGVAVTAGVWDDAALDVTAPTGTGCQTIIANASIPSLSNSTTWCQAASNTINPGGANSNCDTGISCPNEGDIIITEIFNDANGVDTGKEWFEVYNTSGSDIDINGWTISDLGSDDHTINNGGPLMVTSNAYIVLGQSTNMANNGGITVDYEYSGIALSNGDDELVLTCDPMGAPIGIDTVQYDGGINFPDNTGSSISLNPNYLNSIDNDNGSNWCDGTSPFGTNGDFGTPSLLNDGCAEISIDDVVMSEGNSGSTIFTFTVTTSTAVGSDITFDINTTDGTATSPSDFIAIVGGSGTILMNTLTTTVDVTVNGDTDLEPNEAFGVVISNVSSNATILDGTGMGIINDDDNSCPTDYAGPNALTGTITGTEDYETDGIIESTQIIDATAVVDYDSATEINLNANFEVVLGAVFNAFIDGCGGIMIQEGNIDLGNK